MSNVEERLSKFVDEMGEGVFIESVSKDLMNKYKGKILLEKDTVDLLPFIWEEMGFRSYKNGLFTMVNPDDYYEVAQGFFKVSKEVIVFAKTACGGLFALDDTIAGKAIVYINPHKNKREIVSTSIEMFLSMEIPFDDFWEDDCKAGFELRAIAHHGSVAPDVCLAFVLALALGGSGKVSTMQKVKVKEQLALLAELHSGN